MLIKSRDVSENIVIDIFSEEVSNNELSEIKRIIKNSPIGTRIAVNLENVSKLNNSFWDFLLSSSRPISIFNLKNNVNALLYLLNLDKSFELYLNEEDFLMEKRRIVNRSFKLCS